MTITLFGLAQQFTLPTVEGSDRAPTAQAVRTAAALEQRARGLLSSTLR